MMLKAVFALVLALGMASVVVERQIDPIPQCWPCPDDAR
jgi:hypothetical protein